ncbi:MAG: BatD family protein [Salinimicrobium sediminis]|nr:BatD family protein [Salinimicrobium sediminis]
MEKRLRQNHLFDSLWKAVLVSCLLTFFLAAVSVSALAQEVSASVDTTNIKIGEQITYRLSVESDGGSPVVFPEGQTFSPLEMIEAYAIDTSEIGDRQRLIREYALTQFDSGQYTIPQQRVLINDREFRTDSFSVVVNDVVVDTTKQKMYPIKPAVEVPPAFGIPQWLWWLLGLILLGIVGYLLYKSRQKRKEAAKQLPPYEQALYELKQLDDSHLLEQREIKEYYSQLSAAVRRYLDGEVYDHALESTTNELIAYLEAERDRGKLKLENTTISKLKIILERADLAKFANSKPDVLTAKEDRASVENVIKDTKASIPQPTEEELLADQEYRERLERKRKVKKIIFGILAVVILISAATAYIISTKGLDYFADTYLGNTSKEMLEGEWIESEYGTPPVSIASPDVLVRELKDSTAVASGKETFNFGSLESSVFLSVNTRPAGEDFNLEGAVEEVYSYLEANGAKNIITKQEEFETLNGAKGMKIFGTMSFQKSEKSKPIQKEYAILNFGMGEGYQQIVMIYNEGDKYAEEITQRVSTSVELIKMEN